MTKKLLIGTAIVSCIAWLGLGADPQQLVCPCGYVVKNVAELKARLSAIKDDRDVIIWANGGVIKIMRYDRVEYEYIIVGQPRDGLPDPYEDQPKPEYARKQKP